MGKENHKLMSKLDSFIRRLSAQLQCLSWASCQVDGIEGDILDLGLGNGRTYDHLRLLFRGRRCLAAEVDKVCINQHPEIPRQNIILGDIRETLSQFAACSFAVIHCDIGDWEAGVEKKIILEVGSILANLLMPQGVLLSSIPISDDTLTEGVGVCHFKNRYFTYNKTRMV